MATTNQRNKTDGRKESERKSPAKRGAPQETHSIADMRDDVTGYISQGAEQFREMTRDREGTAVLVALAAGVGIGLFIGSALASSHARPRRWTDRATAEGIGRRFMERVESMIPKAVSEHFSR